MGCPAVGMDCGQDGLGAQMSNVVPLGNITRLDLDPQRVLQAAMDAGLTEVVICGWDANGDRYFASSVADGGIAGYHLDRAKWALMRTIDDLEAGA